MLYKQKQRIDNLMQFFFIKCIGPKRELTFFWIEEFNN